RARRWASISARPSARATCAPTRRTPACRSAGTSDDANARAPSTQGGRVTGVVLTEFVEFAEGRLAIPLPDASFSVPEHYEPATFLALVDRVATQAALTRRAVLERFGVHLFGRFAALYPAFFVGGSAMDLLRTINTYVHGEVQKLY